MKLPLHARRAIRWAGFAAIAVFLVLVGRFWHPVYGFTAFLQMAESTRQSGPSELREKPVATYTDGYDGQFYAVLSSDPLLRSPETVAAVDNLPYRARRILPSALAWLLGAGRVHWSIQVYSVLNVASWLALAALTWRLLVVSNFRSWLAWVGLLFSAGALHSVRLALTDLIATTFIAASLYCQEHHRPRSAAASLAAAALSKETSILAVAGLFRSPGTWGRNLFCALAVVAPLSAWLLYIRCVTAPSDAGWSNFALPFSGFIEKWCNSIHGLAHPAHFILAWSTLLATAAVTVQCVWLLIRPQLRDPLWWAAMPFVGLTTVLDTIVWEGHPGAFTRVLLPLQLLFNLLAVRRRATIPWLIGGNLGVLSGVIALLNPAAGSLELAHGRTSSHAVVAHAGEGWYPTEASWTQKRTWSSGSALIPIKLWPHDAAADVRIEFSIRARTPRRLVITMGQTLLWQGELGTERQTIILPHVHVPGGGAQLAFLTDSPASPESSLPEARPLAFALYNLRIDPLD